MPWPTRDFEVPARLDVSSGHHLRPIRAADVDIDYPAVMSSQARLWELFGETSGWPLATLSYEQDREDLAEHEADMAARRAFCFAVLDIDERRLLGCVYIDPSEAEGVDAEVTWWLVDAAVGSVLESALTEALPKWIAHAWPLSSVQYHPGLSGTT
jgi:hypothetical protein